jgi:hypothetical protein
MQEKLKHPNIKDFMQKNINDTSQQPVPFIDHLL